ncbi:ferritin-like domain-containing protein [Flavobacterium sp.]|uniref:ferritin-like domain-containing protein n=1 Tax=Flavobacterium sp. TaxID=239 RepID=UPI0012266A2B|nr:ferritin-like domain-containing protein [Flavobacterium sp.]RZJ73932.1 MAG: ferritin-like domain-containing protein [Flavobacterium sp.]
MNISKILELFSDDALYTKTGDRRSSFGAFGQLGKGLAFAAVPFGLSALTNKSYAADISPTPATATGALQLALTLEYLEAEYYNTALDTAGLIPQADQAIIAQIAQHENAHVTFLAQALGADAPPIPVFDFTGGNSANGGGPFNPFGDYQTFLQLAQAFEDTGVRAYKGQAGNLMSNPALLTAALQIHSVEARHASQVRRLRGQKGWIVGSDRGGLPVQAQPVYEGEQNTLQAGFNTASVNNTANGPAIPASAGAESFDEPIDTATAVTIANLFIV